MAKYPHDKTRPSPRAVIRALKTGNMNALKLALSVRMRRFAEEYIIDFNGAAAAVRAGYAVPYADRQAHTLLKHEGVSAYIDHLTRSKENKIVSVNPDYVIGRVMEIIGKDNAKDGDRLRGLELLARHLGMFVDKTEISGPGGGPIETQKIEEEAQSFTNLLKTLRDRALREAHASSEKTDVVLV